MKNTHTTKLALRLIVALAGPGCVGGAEDIASASQALDTAPLAARSSTLDLGSVAVGSTVTGSVALTDVSRDVVDVVDITVDDSFPPDPCRAVVIQPCIFPGQTTALEVTCAPTAAGNFGGRVTVRYHAGSQYYTLAVALSGSAVARTR